MSTEMHVRRPLVVGNWKMNGSRELARQRTTGIAYEPVSAIGTGRTAGPQMAAEVHALVRDWIARIDLEAATTIRILYGGSVKPSSARALFAQPDIDADSLAAHRSLRRIFWPSWPLPPGPGLVLS